MAKPCRTTWSEALCMLPGMTPTIIKLQEPVQRYNKKERSSKRKIDLDYDVDLKHWPHPADAVTINEIVGNDDA
jgi:hypothetical protein